MICCSPWEKKTKKQSTAYCCRSTATCIYPQLFLSYWWRTNLTRYSHSLPIDGCHIQWLNNNTRTVQWCQRGLDNPLFKKQAFQSLEDVLKLQNTSGQAIRPSLSCSLSAVLLPHLPNITVPADRDMDKCRRIQQLIHEVHNAKKHFSLPWLPQTRNHRSWRIILSRFGWRTASSVRC